MAGKSPTQRSLDHLRKQGYLADIVERRLTKFVTKDWLGFADIIAVNAVHVLAVQVTDRSNVSHRIKKIHALEHFPLLQAMAIEIRVHGWGRMASGEYELREEFL